MKTFIVLIPIKENSNARKQCENIENTIFEFKNETSITALNVQKKVIEFINDNTYDLSTIEVESLTNFMDRVNDEQFNPDNYFTSYVHAK